jgi:hypothetical protein
MKNRILIGIALTVATLVVVSGILLTFFRPEISAFLRNRVQKALSEEFESHVEFSDFNVVFYPRPFVTVSNLTLRHRDRTDVPPLIQVEQVSVAMNWHGLLEPRVHISWVGLKGLQLTFPPRPPHQASADIPQKSHSPSKYSVLIAKMEAQDAKITLLRGQPEKPPLEFLLHQLTLSNMSFDGVAAFEATLTNAVPRGEIYTKGEFGPWDSDTPRATHVQGSYDFEHADMSTIKGLQGILSSTGTFDGPLDLLQVKGTTNIPDFTLHRVGNPIPLRTVFSATVDGTNGNTYLHSVEARFLHSRVQTQGEIVDKDKDIRGRTINLDAQSDDARAEDMIRLAVKTDRPVLNGPVKFKAKIRIPEEPDEDLSDRLDVVAQFVLSDGHFTNENVQSKIDSLSRRGQGKPKDTDIAEVPTALVASMHWEKSVIAFSKIDFSVPGANLDLQGKYTPGGGDLDFYGNLFLDAKLSQTTTGAKSFLLKAVDPFFKGKNGGARIPVVVAGTKDHPHFGLGHVKGAKGQQVPEGAENSPSSKSD